VRGSYRVLDGDPLRRLGVDELTIDEQLGLGSLEEAIASSGAGREEESAAVGWLDSSPLALFVVVCAYSF